ncbi:hypothetical protein M758_UG071100 [Ceratodon purpureus]|nr:hypothetical protein M758_UG071100 [Ceratodon purpureus]
MNFRRLLFDTALTLRSNHQEPLLHHQRSSLCNQHPPKAGLISRIRLAPLQPSFSNSNRGSYKNFGTHTTLSSPNTRNNHPHAHIMPPHKELVLLYTQHTYPSTHATVALVLPSTC